MLHYIDNMKKIFVCEFCGFKTEPKEEAGLTAFRCMKCWNWNDIADMDKEVNRVTINEM